MFAGFLSLHGARGTDVLYFAHAQLNLQRQLETFSSNMACSRLQNVLSKSGVDDAISTFEGEYQVKIGRIYIEANMEINIFK